MPRSDFSVSLRLADPTDAASLATIYNYYVETSIATFEEISVDAEEMARRIGDVRSKDLPWYVAVEASKPIGLAYATPWRPRGAYRFSAEVTVYVAQGKGGNGVGIQLQTAVLNELRKLGFHAALAGIALPNSACMALHERLGFEKVAHSAKVELPRP